MAKTIWKNKQVVSSHSANPDAVQAVIEGSEPTTIGELLQAKREACGFDLRDVANILRIRYRYLEAIEGNQFDDLPGTTYVVGFVRTYAEYLGLEGAEIVDRFRRETNTSNSKSELIFPQPIVEAKVPGRAVLLIAVFLAVLIYSSWIYLSSQGQTFGSIITDVQRRMATITGDGNNGSASTAPTLLIHETSEKIEESNVDDGLHVVREFTDSTIQTVTTNAVAPDEQSASYISVTSIKEKLEGSLDAEDRALYSGSTVMSIVPDTSTDAGAKIEQSTEIAGLPTLTRDNQTVGESQEAIFYGAENSDSRITIEALSDSWVEIKDAEGELLLTRVLRMGDSYFVPDRLGLTMITGNAGALRIIVDGDPVQRIGPRGSVRRDVKLDPEILKKNIANSF